MRVGLEVLNRLPRPLSPDSPMHAFLVLATLLAAGARTGVKAKGGATPMMMAVIFNRADNVAALLEGGYDVKPELDMLRGIAASYPDILKMIEAAAKK